ncbi:arylsulfatase [Flavivirga algicola]|uniref:Arylsulfatase n=1 Tax=Flavivirga algicola TaxID=2729136 RepID=A0ABX1RTC5_9FLAO|nr:arylsulfatase [Flavivirga algicola]NMH86801.1 arylsulfatase [Flavivirga algicola]
MIKTKLALRIVIGLTLCVSCKKTTQHVDESKKEEVKKPNIIYILADDLGYGDLSCYGQEKFKTPNIDALASRGIKFTQHYSGAAVCAPARSSLMTGQHTGHTPIRGNKEIMEGKGGQVPLPASSITIAEVLKEAGYVTGMFGKWGLGFNEGDPNTQGFDEFYGYNDQKLAHRYYPPYLNHNKDIDSLEGNDWTQKVTYAPDRIQEETLKFIENNKDTPFFAYIPSVIPHAELIVPNDTLFSKYNGRFEEVPLKNEEKYTSDYGDEDMKFYEYCPQEKPYATYATMIDRLDKQVGEIVAKLETLGLSENTIIMFASDNGPAREGGANPDFFNSNGGLKGIKRDLYEGGIRSPFITVWPKKIKAGTVSNHISAFWDIMPTLADLAGIETPKQSDGISMLPTLLGNENQKQHDYLYWEFNIKGGRKAIRKGNWKGVWYSINKKKQGNFELYDLSKDLAEENNIAEEHPEIVKELKSLMHEASVASDLFSF